MVVKESLGQVIMDALHLCIHVIGQLMVQLHGNKQNVKGAAAANQLMRARTERSARGQSQPRRDSSTHVSKHVFFFIIIICLS